MVCLTGKVSISFVGPVGCAAALFAAHLVQERSCAMQAVLAASISVASATIIFEVLARTTGHGKPQQQVSICGKKHSQKMLNALKY